MRFPILSKIKEKREDYRKPVNFILNAYQGGSPRVAVAADLSLGGMRLRQVGTPHRTQGSRIDLEFQLPEDQEVFYVQGECVHQASGCNELSVRFVGQSQRLLLKLKKFMEMENLSNMVLN